ncbi:hypothetical protein AKJ09_08427 [Labilithrix luteola]|uniref:Uncharacterized protein n=1 Tax=Labilithrix luteola TaxID=1391654 RepID=A0A0K1Q7S2_9BACT|nr:hypothetical protein AKJ09_08427 [Labilithrix luteola]
MVATGPPLRQILRWHAAPAGSRLSPDDGGHGLFALARRSFAG